MVHRPHFNDLRPSRSPGWSALSGVVAALLLVASVATAGTVADAGRVPQTVAGFPPGERLIFTQIPTGGPTFGRSAAGLPDGSRIVSLDGSAATGEVTVLSGGFVAAGHPDLSFDGRRILFVGKRDPNDPLNVWEMGIDGDSPRQITRRSTDCGRAIYLSTLYTLDAERPVYQLCFTGADPGRAASLYTARMDGSRVRRIAYDPIGVRDPLLLSDGRLLYGSWRPAGGGSPAGQLSIAEPASSGGLALFTVNTDGTDVSVFAAAHEPAALRTMPCETPDGRVIYVESNGSADDPGGDLVAVSRARSLHTRQVVTHDPAGRYHSPSPLPDGRLLVSYRAEDGESYGIHVLDPTRDTRIPVYDEPRWHEVDARIVRPRREPSGRSSVVKDDVEYGYLYGLDVGLSDTAEAGRAEPGEIKRLRVMTPIGQGVDSRGVSSNGAPAPAGDAGEALLGEVPVEPDGSFYFELPARVPVRLQTVNAHGEIVQAMRSWIWVMPNESRGCIGCHEDRELAPPNRHVLALRKAPSVVGFPGHRRVRPSRPAHPPYSERGERDE